jgi:hypothetical protein
MGVYWVGIVKQSNYDRFLMLSTKSMPDCLVGKIPNNSKYNCVCSGLRKGRGTRRKSNENTGGQNEEEKGGIYGHTKHFLLYS